ncbi:hypothetical protein B0T22DRAFT_457000 [Podospora appendiculata]|uniref:Uncharacterized protein n=1 Tax=Podospora appendiculata TaxID=314037 RepID=A0AAE0X750_9PEZI|nr:hypothetical protein B0T22DRAFT_457000 [Podospora appendiculata]
MLRICAGRQRQNLHSTVSTYICPVYTYLGCTHALNPAYITEQPELPSTGAGAGPRSGASISSPFPLAPFPYAPPPTRLRVSVWKLHVWPDFLSSRPPPYSQRPRATHPARKGNAEEETPSQVLQTADHRPSVAQHQQSHHTSGRQQQTRCVTLRTVVLPGHRSSSLLTLAFTLALTFALTLPALDCCPSHKLPDRLSDRLADTCSDRSVNQLLADLRRVGVSSGAQRALDVRPTVPPSIRDILQIAETPAPRPRRPQRVDGSGIRPPPGPAAPRSWLTAGGLAQRHGSSPSSSRHSVEHRPLPGAYMPEPSSLMDMTLRRLATDWEFQRTYCHHYLYDLPTHLRVALFTYVGMWSPEGLSLADLRVLLLPPVYTDDSDDGEQEVNNADFHHLDLTNAIGRSLRLRELSDLLFPPHSASASAAPKDTWDAPDQPAAANIPRPLLPNLTHLSLALDPHSPTSVSWRHLLAFASHSLATLTHLSLAFWPAPSLTNPSAKFASVVSPEGRVVQYGGTGPYSHSLDGDWVEAVMVLARLARSLYGLEYLDLTGCGAWLPALWSSAGHDVVDWVGCWGKVATLVLDPGYRLAEDADVVQVSRFWEVVDWGRSVERHVRAKRAGTGRFFTVETCRRDSELG